MDSYSQLGQDLDVLKLYSNKSSGTFIEIGASDGKMLSNTYLLEQIGWKGICVEPIPEKFELLQKNRKSINVNKAVYKVSGQDITFTVAIESLLSGITSEIDKYHTVKNTGTTISVKTITLNDLIKESGLPNFIEYLSIDTEGSEYEILKALDFSKYTFGTIHVEHNFVMPKREQIRSLLTSNGYKFLQQNRHDDYYIHNSLNPPKKIKLIPKFFWSKKFSRIN
uniref:Methyltransferase FkbM domain-containing protein n=1 Tax=viral metagenome TaxID=1070528 RepID=A0A6C0HGE3_9ZZZZ